MSLIEYFYNIFPLDVVFQILTYKPHPCAELIKKDVCLLEKNLKNLQYAEGFMCLRKIEKLIKKKEKFEEKKDKNMKKLKDSINDVSVCRSACENSDSCRQLSNEQLILCEKSGNYCKRMHYCDYVIPCNHSENIEKYERFIKKYCDDNLEYFMIRHKIDTVFHNYRL